MPQDQRGHLEQAQIESNKRVAHWTRIVGIFTIVLAVVTAVTGAFTGWQAYTAATTARETREQLRAVMQLTGIQPIFGPVDTGETGWGFSASFQNFGGTRASSVVAEQSAQYFEGTVPNNTDFSKPRMELTKATPNIVGAGAIVAIRPLNVKTDEIQKAVRKEGIIVIWGKMHYFDLFNPSSEHVILFCQQILPTQTNKDGPISFSFAPLRPDCNTAS
jgi:hypothetical protein